MIVKVFANRGGGSAGASLDYLLGKNRDREGATVLKGDPELSLAIAESLEFKNRYTVGCLSFEEATIDPKAKVEIMERFEEMIFAGLDKDQYNITWIEHNDKGRVELNYFIPNVELSTQKRLQPYYDKVDRPMVDCFKKVINHEYGLSNPDLLEKKQKSKINNTQAKDSKELKEIISKFVVDKISTAEITTREQVIQVLKDSKYDVVRVTDKSISIKNPDVNKGRNIRLSGELYEKEFYETIRNTRELGASLEETRIRAEARDRESHTESYERSKAEFYRRVEYRSEQFSKSYPKKNIVERHTDNDYSNIINNLAEHGYMVLESQSGSGGQQSRISQVTARKDGNRRTEEVGSKTTEDQGLHGFDRSEMEYRRPVRVSGDNENSNENGTERKFRVQNNDYDTNNQETAGVITFHELFVRSREYCKKLGERAKNTIQSIQRIDGKIREALKGIHDSQPNENERNSRYGKIGEIVERNRLARSISHRASETINLSEQQSTEASRAINEAKYSINNCYEQTERTNREFGATVEAINQKITRDQERNRGWSMSR